MIREERELFAELARLNREMAPLAMRMMEGVASRAEQQDYARRLIAIGERLWRRAGEVVAAIVIEGEVLPDEPLRLPMRAAESHREP